MDRHTLELLGSLLLVAGVVGGGVARAADTALRADLEAVARRSVLFGHQSVGEDILAGLRDLAAQEGVPLRIVEVASAEGLEAGTLAHVRVAENGKPLLKLERFEWALGPAPAPLDAALVKFCYVDLLEDGDPRALFERYQVALAGLRARHPGTTFLRATVPLTAVPTGPKAFVKRLLGRERSEHHDARREEFNALVRDAWRGPEPLFDLARVESTRPDGRPETWPVGGRAVPALVPAYTHDGGHLNEVGRRRAARELLRVLAALPPRTAR